MADQDISQRGNWGSKIAFIFAASGSAIGLGSIWRFPLMTGLNGGAIFVLVYIVAVIFIGFTVMLAEFVLGRHTAKNPVGAYEAIKPRTPWKLAGYMGVFGCACILSYTRHFTWVISPRNPVLPSRDHRTDNLCDFQRSKGGDRKMV